MNASERASGRQHGHSSSVGRVRPDGASDIPALDPYAPADLGPIRLRNRLIKAATFEGRTRDQVVTQQLIDFHRAMAGGGVGLTTVAYCAVRNDGTTDGRQLWWRDDVLPGMRRLTDAIHSEGAAISAQIGHSGPVADGKAIGAPTYAPSKSFNALSRRFNRAATEQDIAEIVEAFAKSARMAEDSGFDCVELHFGHNYFISAFLSPRLNKRTDQWGGSLENRARLARLVAKTVREATGGRIAVTAKLSMDDGVGGGLRPPEAIQVAQWLEQDGALDALELTAGSSLLNPMYLFRGGAPIKEFAANFSPMMRVGLKAFGKNFIRAYPYTDLFLLETAKKFRAAVSMPLILLGGVTSHDTVMTAMAEGFDFVAMGRALLMEPDLPNRMRADHSTTSACIHCNRCMPTIYSRTRCVLVEPDA